MPNRTTMTVLAAVAVIFPTLLIAQAASTPRPAITGISHITLFADDLPKSEHFYAELLGWDQVPSSAAKSGVRFYANHSQYVELVTPPRAGLADRLDFVAFSTTDADALRKYLGAHGISVPKEVTVEADGSRSLLVHDPEGNRVGFTQDGPHPPEEPSSASQSLSSHIIHAGYVVRDRAALDHFYKDLLGFHLYWQGGNPDTRIDWVMMQVPDGKRLDRVHAEPTCQPIASSARERQPSRPWRRQRRRAAGKTGSAGLETRVWQESAGTRCRRQDATRLKRPRWHKNRIHGVRAGEEGLLFAVYRPAAEPVRNLVIAW